VQVHLLDALVLAVREPIERRLRASGRVTRSALLNDVGPTSLDDEVEGRTA